MITGSYKKYSNKLAQLQVMEIQFWIFIYKMEVTKIL